MSVRTLLVAADVVIVCFGVATAFYNYSDCDSVHLRRPLHRLFQAVVVINTTAVAVSLCCVCCVGVTCGSKRSRGDVDSRDKPSYGTSTDTGSDGDEHLVSSVAKWARRCQRMGRRSTIHLNPLDGDDVVDVFEVVGRVLAHTFEGVERLQLTPSDIAAGLALVRVVQKRDEHADAVAWQSQSERVSAQAAYCPCIATDTILSTTATTLLLAAAGWMIVGIPPYPPLC